MKEYELGGTGEDPRRVTLTPRTVGQRLCEALGIDTTTAREVTIRIDSTGTHVTVERVPTRGDGGPLLEAFDEFELVPKNEVRWWNR